MRIAAVALLIALLPAGIGRAESPAYLFEEDFEDGDLSGWITSPPEQFEIVSEPDSTNRVLELSPRRGDFAHLLIDGSTEWQHVRVEGRFLFPTHGDGYLGFLHNYQQSDGRMDFGCLYVKSNGSYIRISPHHDGNPSWRLYEELRVDLEGDRRIEVGRWYDFRLDVRGRRVDLAIDDLDEPLATFDLFPNERGAVGFEARPGGGERVWLDDVRVSSLPASTTPSRSAPAAAPSELAWEVLGPIPSDGEGLTEPPAAPAEGWRPILPDRRGALITGLFTQYRSGDATFAYLRTRFEVDEDGVGPRWLAVSSANRLDVWLNGHYRGTVAPERFIWSDFRGASDHPGARIPIHPEPGPNELLLRVHGRRFAGGGLFLSLADASE